MNDNWTQSALHYLRWFLRSKAYAGVPFLIEDFRQWAKLKGLDDPPDLRRFGIVTRLALADRIIEPTRSYAAAKSSHGSGKRLYRKPTC